MLITVEQFRQYASNTKYANETDYPDNIIEPYIEIASIYTENYLDRKLLEDDYIEQFQTDFTDTIIPEQYPINYVNGIFVHQQSVFSYVISDGYYVTVNTIGRSVDVITCDAEGEIVKYSFPKDDYKNVSQLVSAMNNDIPDLDAEVIMDIPTNYLSEINETKEKLIKGYGLGYTQFMDNFVIDVKSNVIYTGYNVAKGLIRYNAGYQELPKEIVKFVADLIVFLMGLAETADKKENSNFKSEKLGDYNYVRFDSAEFKSDLDMFFDKNANTIQKYKKISV